MGGNASSKLSETAEWRAQFVATVPSGVAFKEHSAQDAFGTSKRTTAWFSWLPAAAAAEIAAPKGIVVVAHGLHEHSLRYHTVACALAARNFAVYSADHIGHGCTAVTDGSHVAGLIPDRTALWQDFSAFVTHARQQHAPETPLFLLAHSMGTLVALRSLTSIPDVRAAVLSGCALVSGAAASSPFGCACCYPLTKTSVAASLTACLASMDANGPAAPIEVSELSNSADVLAAHAVDPRVYHGWIRNKTAAELIALIAECKIEAPRITLPLQLHHGAADQITLVEGSEWLLQNVGTAADQKQLHVHAGLKHELFSDGELGARIVAQIASFYESKL